MKKLLSLFLMVGFVALLIGCHAGGNAPFINVKDPGKPYEYARVNANGKMDHDIFFNHSDGGQTIITCDNGTFEEGVEVRVTETNTTLNELGSNQNVYIYTVEAYKGNTPVQTLEKPLKITLPTNHLGSTGVCYVGVKYPGSSNWSYRMVEDGTITLNSRLSSASELKPSYDCGIYRMGIQIALFLYNEANVKEEQKSNLVSVNKVTTTSSTNAETGNLDLSINMEGENIGKLDAKNISVRVTFKSTDPKEIVINSQKTKPVRDDKASDGKTYYYELPLPSLESDGLTKAVLTYSFNLKDLTTENFPEGFLIELSGEAPDSLIKNFSYSEFYTYSSESGDDQPSGEGDTETQYQVSIVGSEGTSDISGSGDYKVGDTVTLSVKIQSGYEFDSWTSSDIDVDSDSVVKSEKDGVYSISFILPDKEVTVNANAKKKEEQSGIELSGENRLTINLGDGIKINLIKPEGKDYYLGETEVTQAQYFKIMGTNPSGFKGDSSADEAPTTTANYPVEKVKYIPNIVSKDNPDDAFIGKLNAQLADQLTENNLSGYNFTLPTVEQWEYCFYAGNEESDYGVGENGEEITDSNIGDYAVYDTDSPTEVKSKKPNAWGFYDMHGNVVEWTSTAYSGYRLHGGNYKSSSTSSLKPSKQITNWYASEFVTDDNFRGNFGFRIALVKE